jgi:hypothetical protein
MLSERNCGISIPPVFSLDRQLHCALARNEKITYAKFDSAPKQGGYFLYRVSSGFFFFKHHSSCLRIVSLLKCLLPLLPRTPSPTLRLFIRRTILSDIQSANSSHKNHRLNRAMQAMLFVMVERGVDGRVTGNKGKTSLHQTSDEEDEAMWAIILAKELWGKKVWYVFLTPIQGITDHEIGWTRRQLLL